MRNKVWSIRVNSLAPAEKEKEEEGKKRSFPTKELGETRSKRGRGKREKGT